MSQNPNLINVAEGGVTEWAFYVNKRNLRRCGGRGLGLSLDIACEKGDVWS